MKPLTEDGRSRELPDRLRLTARRTPSGLQALRSLLGLAAGPVSRTPSPEDKLLLEIAFAVASDCRNVAGRKIDAGEALRIGLVNRVMPQAELEDYAAELTQQLGGNGPQAVRGAKQAVHDGLDQDLDSALALETSLFALCFAGDEQREGMSAFVEKRKPNF